MIAESKQYEDVFFATLTEAGVHHQQNNIPNQDAVAIEWIDNGYLLAVADGVGSCRNADIGARAAIDAARSFFRDLLSSSIEVSTKDHAEVLIRYWREKLIGYIEDECCTTLKCAVKAKDKLYLFSIGDGFIAFSSDEEQIISPLTQYDFGNETDCLSSNTRTSDFWFRCINIKETMTYTVFACTDGIANGLIDDTELNMVRTINKEIPSSQLLEQLTDLFQDISRVSSDDKTMGVIRHDKRDEKSEWHNHNHRNRKTI